MRISTDKRSRDVDLTSAPEWELEPIHREMRPLQVRAARAVVAMREKGRQTATGCGTVEQLVTRFGFSVEEGRSLYLVGRALQVFPERVQSFLDGDVTYTALERLGRVRQCVNLCLELTPESGFPSGSPGDVEHHRRRKLWLKKAVDLSSSGFRRYLAKERADRRNREPVVEVREWLPVSVDEELSRAQVVASRKAKRLLSRSETIGETVAHYLDTFDDKLPDTCGDNRCDGTCEVCGIDEKTTLFDARRRKLPARVMRIVRRRAGDCCEYPGCTNEIFLEFAHLKPHRQGGSRSPLNIGLLCHENHFQLDAGLIRFLGFGPDGLVFEDPQGVRRGGMTWSEASMDEALLDEALLEEALLEEALLEEALLEEALLEEDDSDEDESDEGSSEEAKIDSRVKPPVARVDGRRVEPKACGPP